jgi:hypothetical protein
MYMTKCKIYKLKGDMIFLLLSIHIPVLHFTYINTSINRLMPFNITG